jgi:glycosyltransferase involved in cell wall biosynthesis
MNNSSVISAAISTSEINDLCEICKYPYFRRQLINLPCNHFFHISCLLYNWKINNTLHSKCPQCKKTHWFRSIVENQKRDLNIIVFYDEILGIHREQCKHINHRGIQCHYHEYPFRDGYCKIHSLLKIPIKHEMNIKRAMEIFIYLKDYLNELNIIRIVYIYLFYMYRYQKNPVLFEDFNDIILDLSNILQKFSSIHLIYSNYGFSFPYYLEQRIKRLIKKKIF